MTLPSVTPAGPAVAEVVVRHQGRIVDVQHIRWSEPPALPLPSTNNDVAAIAARLESMQADLDALRAEVTEIQARLDRTAGD